MKKKHILKPGRHQFTPGSHPVHTDENLTDEEAEWYMEKYPHIVALFITTDPPFESEPEAVEQTDEVFLSEPIDEYITFLNH